MLKGHAERDHVGLTVALHDQAPFAQSVAAWKDSHLGVMATALKFVIAGVKRRGEGFGKREVAGVVRRVVVPEFPYSIR